MHYKYLIIIKRLLYNKYISIFIWNYYNYNYITHYVGIYKNRPARNYVL